MRRALLGLLLYAGAIGGVCWLLVMIRLMKLGGWQYVRWVLMG